MTIAERDRFCWRMDHEGHPRKTKSAGFHREGRTRVAPRSAHRPSRGTPPRNTDLRLEEWEGSRAQALGLPAPACFMMRGQFVPPDCFTEASHERSLDTPGSRGDSHRLLPYADPGSRRAAIEQDEQIESGADGRTPQVLIGCRRVPKPLSAREGVSSRPRGRAPNQNAVISI